MLEKNKVNPLKNKLTEKDKQRIREIYNRDEELKYGAPTIARMLGFKGHVVSKFLRDEGLVRTRAEAYKCYAYAGNQEVVL